MYQSTLKRTLAMCFAWLLCMPVTVQATNGYFLIGTGAKSRAMGGTGIAYSNDALAAAANPAAMTEVDMNALRVDIGLELFHPPRALYHNSATLPADEKSGSNLFLIPNGGAIYKFNRKLWMGMAMAGAGSNTRYNQKVPGNPDCANGEGAEPGKQNSYLYNFNCNADSTTAGVNLIQMQMLPSVAYKVNKNHSIGASLALAVQTFRAYGLGAFEDLGFAASSDNVSGEGNDWSYGAGVRFGWLGDFFDGRLSLGTNYSSRVYMTDFDKYKNLFAEHGSFDIPENYGIGLAFKLTDKLIFTADVVRIRYDKVKSVNNPGPSAKQSDIEEGIFNPQCSVEEQEDEKCKLGGDKGLGFGWDDQFVYKIGAEYRYNERFTFRGGFNYGKKPMAEDQILFNMIAPAVVQKHITLGMTYALNKNMELSFNYMHAFKEDLNGPTRYPPAGATKVVDNASAEMYQDSFGVSFGYRM